MSNKLKRKARSKDKTKETGRDLLCKLLHKDVNNFILGNSDSVFQVKVGKFDYDVRNFLCSAYEFAMAHKGLLYDDSFIYNEAKEIIDNIDKSEFFFDYILDYDSKYLDTNSKISICDHFNILGYIISHFLSRYDKLESNKDKINLVVMLIALNTVLFDKEINLDIEKYIYNSDEVYNSLLVSYIASKLWVINTINRFKFLSGILSSKSLYYNEESMCNFLNKVCPENSLHYQYLTGSITVDELAEKYDLVKDYDEFENILSNKDRGIDNRIVSSFYNRTIDDFNSLLGRLMFSTGFMNALATSVFKLAKDINSVRDNIGKLESKENKYISQVKEKEVEIKGLNREVSKLKKKVEILSKPSSNEIKLNQKIAELISENNKLKGELEVKEQSICESRSTIKSQIKELKSLESRLNEVTKENEELKALSSDNEICNTENENSMETILNFLSKFKIGVIGMDNIKTLKLYLDKYNLNIKYFDETYNFTVGEIDCMVILTKSVTHAMVERLNSLYSGKIIYFNGSNANLFLNEVYNNLVCDM